MSAVKRLIMWLCLGAVALACLSCSMAGPGAVTGVEASARGVKASAAPDPGQVGPYAIGHASFKFYDSSRRRGGEDRPVPVEVFYPVDPSVVTSGSSEAIYPLDPIGGTWPETTSSDWEKYGLDRAYEGLDPSSAGPFPLVIFSPGWACPIWGYHFFLSRIASHGFVTAVMYHYGYGALAGEPFDHVAMDCVNGPLDVSFVLDRLLEMNQTPGELLQGLIVPDLIAASGHSLGGYDAMALVTGVDLVGEFFYGEAFFMSLFGPPPPESMVSVEPDPRIKVIVPLDGANQILRFGELRRLCVPSMGIGQEWSTLASQGMATWQARQHLAFGGHPNYRVDVAYSDHFGFTNMRTGFTVARDKGVVGADFARAWWAPIYAGPQPIEESTRVTAKYAIAFLQTVLAAKPGYQDILTPGHALKRETIVEFFVTEKRNPESIEDEWPPESAYFDHQPGSEQAKRN